MAKYNEETKFDYDNINPVEFRVLDKQADIILRALELYIYNLEYMLDCENANDEERQNKIAKVKYTYELILSAKAEQVNINIDNNTDNQNEFERKIPQSDNIINIIPDKKEIQAV